MQGNRSHECVVIGRSIFGVALGGYAGVKISHCELFVLMSYGAWSFSYLNAFLR